MARTLLAGGIVVLTARRWIHDRRPSPSRDPLTGLPDRRAFESRMEQLLQPRDGGRGNRSPSCSSILTTSSASTTSLGTCLETRCSPPLLGGWRPRSGPAIWRRGMAAMNSWSSSIGSATRKPPAGSPRDWGASCAGRSGWRAGNSPSPQASGSSSAEPGRATRPVCARRTRRCTRRSPSAAAGMSCSTSGLARSRDPQMVHSDRAETVLQRRFPPATRGGPLTHHVSLLTRSCGRKAISYQSAFS